MKNYSFFIVFLIVILAVTNMFSHSNFIVNALPNYVIDGNIVYVNDTNCYIAAYPHTINTGQYVYLNVTSKKYEGQVDFCFGFDRNIVKPRSLEFYKPHNITVTHSQNLTEKTVDSTVNVYNSTYLELENQDFLVNASYASRVNPYVYNGVVWVYQNLSILENNVTVGYKWDQVYNHSFSVTNINSKMVYWFTMELRLWKNIRQRFNFTKKSFSYQGMNTWYIANYSVVANKTYHLRFYLHGKPTLEKSKDVKYFIAFKPQSETLLEAKNNGHLYVLDPWFNNDWSYRKSHEIQYASGAGTNYTMKIVVVNGSSSDVNGTVYVDNKTESDFGDIRFTDNDETTELDYWMEDLNSGENATFWVEVADDLTSTNATIYMYYGNSGASTTSNGTDTFIFFDAFYGSSLDTTSKWTVYSGQPHSVSGGYLTVTGVGHNIDYIASQSTFGMNRSLRIKSYFATSLGSSFWGLAEPIFDSGYSSWDSVGYGWYAKGSGSDENEAQYVAADKIREYCQKTNKGKFYEEDVFDFESTNAYDNDAKNIIFREYSSGKQQKIDFALIRKWVDPEPVHGSAWGSEEEAETVSSVSGSIAVQFTINSLNSWTLTRYGNINPLFTVNSLIGWTSQIESVLNQVFTVNTLNGWSFTRYSPVTSSFTVNHLNTWSFLRESILNMVFTANSLNAIGFNLYSSISQTLTVNSMRTYSFLRESMLNPVFTVNHINNWIFNLYSSINQIFTVNGLFDSGVLLGLFGSVTQQFTLNSLNSWTFNTYSILNPTFTINELVDFVGVTFLNLGGSITQQFTLNSLRDWSFSLYSTVNQVFTVNSLAQFIEPILYFYGLIGQIFTVNGAVATTTGITYATTGFVLASLLVSIFILAPIIGIWWWKRP